MNHKLALEVPDTLNTKILRIEDYSDYNENIPVLCPVLEIAAPGFANPVIIDEDKLKPGFALSLTACDLGLQTFDCDKNPLCLPDGIYDIKYAISPREQVYVEYNYLKISNIMNRYKKILCSIPLCTNSEPTEEIEEKLKKLYKAKMFIEAAKAKVEICHDAKKGMELYNYSKKLLSSFDCETC